MTQSLNKTFTALVCTTLLGLGHLALAQDSSPTPSPSASPDTTPASPSDKHGGGKWGGPEGRMHGGMRGGLRLEVLTKELTLTADQQAKIKPILEDSRAKMKALHEDTSVTREEMMPKMKAIHDSTTQQIEAVLTPEQKTKFEEMQSRMRDRRGGMHGGPGGPKSDQ